jgi:hypothetical protein
MERRLGDHKALPLFDLAKLSRVHEYTYVQTFARLLHVHVWLGRCDGHRLSPSLLMTNDTAAD